MYNIFILAQLFYLINLFLVCMFNVHMYNCTYVLCGLYFALMYICLCSFFCFYSIVFISDYIIYT